MVPALGGGGGGPGGNSAVPALSGAGSLRGPLLPGLGAPVARASCPVAGASGRRPCRPSAIAPPPSPSGPLAFRGLALRGQKRALTGPRTVLKSGYALTLGD